MHSRVTASDEISFICIELYTEVVKISKLSIFNMASWIFKRPRQLELPLTGILLYPEFSVTRERRAKRRNY